MAKRRFKKKIISKKHIARQERERQQSTLIRNVAIGVVAVVVLLVGYGYIDQTILQQRQPVAAVGDETISAAQFEARVRLDREGLINQYIDYIQIGQMYGMDMADQTQSIEDRLNDPMKIGQDVLDTMINELLYRQEAKRRGIIVSAEEVEKDIQAQHKYYPDGTPTAAPTATAVVVERSTLSPQQLELVTITPTPTDAPTSMPPPTATPDLVSTPTATAGPTAIPIPSLTPTPYTLEGYEQAYQESLPFYTDLGLTEEDFRFLFESRLYYVKLYEIVTADTPRTSEDIWARHILVADPTLAAIIRERLLEGEDFSVVAAEASIDPSAATNGGDLGWFSRGMMVPPFEEAAYALEIGEISEPVQSDFGYHIIQLLGREERPLSADAYQQAQDIVFQQWLADLREESEIEIFDTWQNFVPTEPNLQQTLSELYSQQQQ